MRLHRVDTGVRTENLLTVYTSRFVTNATREELVKPYTDTWTRVMERLAQLPGVAKVGGGYDIPYKNRPEQREKQQVSTVGQSQQEQQQNTPVMGVDVDPSFFDALGIPLLAGRNFNDNDMPSSEPVCIVSKSAAEALWPGREAIGQKLLVGKLSATNVWGRVIGVVGDTKWHAAETGKGFEVYYSHRQWPIPAFHFLLRVEGDPANLIPQVRRAIHEVNPDIAINEIKPMDEVITEALWQRRLWGTLFADVALLLAGVGVYGVMSYLVSQRTTSHPCAEIPRPHSTPLRYWLAQLEKERRPRVPRRFSNSNDRQVGASLCLRLAQSASIEEALEDLAKVAAEKGIHLYSVSVKRASLEREFKPPNAVAVTGKINELAVGVEGRQTQLVVKFLEPLDGAALCELEYPTHLAWRRIEILAGEEARTQRGEAEGEERSAVIDELAGESELMREVRRDIEIAAGLDLNVLITGEPGTGKELVAKGIHKASNRAKKPFVDVNVAALNSSLIESDIRLVAATNKDLRREVDEGRFRRDLYDRS